MNVYHESVSLLYFLSDTYYTGQGPKVHISGFISYPGGRWVDIDTIEPEKDGNWDLQRLQQQTKRVIAKLHDKYPPDRYELVFTFDHSTIHTKLPEDALRVTQMCKMPGGSKGTKMRSTIWVRNHGYGYVFWLIATRTHACFRTVRSKHYSSLKGTNCCLISLKVSQ